MADVHQYYTVYHDEDDRSVDSWTGPLALKSIAGRCRCGWRGQRRPDTAESGVLAFNEWWSEHYTPLVRPDPGELLILANEGGERRHFLAGRPVRTGIMIELLLSGGHWVPVRYEWSARTDAAPRFYVELGGPWEAVDEHGPETYLLVPLERAVFRWPGTAPEAGAQGAHAREPETAAGLADLASGPQSGLSGLASLSRIGVDDDARSTPIGPLGGPILPDPPGYDPHDTGTFQAITPVGGTSVFDAATAPPGDPSQAPDGRDAGPVGDPYGTGQGPGHGGDTYAGSGANGSGTNGSGTNGYGTNGYGGGTGGYGGGTGGYGAPGDDLRADGYPGTGYGEAGSGYHRATDPGGYDDGLAYGGLDRFDAGGGARRDGGGGLDPYGGLAGDRSDALGGHAAGGDLGYSARPPGERAAAPPSEPTYGNGYGAPDARDHDTGDLGRDGGYGRDEYGAGGDGTGGYSGGGYSGSAYSGGGYGTGDYATGDYATGDYATGDYATGDYATGDYGTGRYGAGDDGTGDLGPAPAGRYGAETAPGAAGYGDGYGRDEYGAGADGTGEYGREPGSAGGYRQSDDHGGAGYGAGYAPGGSRADDSASAAAPRLPAAAPTGGSLYRYEDSYDGSGGYGADTTEPTAPYGDRRQAYALGPAGGGAGYGDDGRLGDQRDRDQRDRDQRDQDQRDRDTDPGVGAAPGHGRQPFGAFSEPLVDPFQGMFGDQDGRSLNRRMGKPLPGNWDTR